ncbi:ATP-binding cassette transporter [Peniophora sp. CONT]|nr:ATP-binding cassette transporter [Peniophora sp. CONT]
MAPIELSVSIALAALVPVSLVGFYFVKPTSSGGEIKLPETADHLEHDAFNVTTPEDVEDGQPIDEAGFWARIRVRKFVLILVLAAIVGLQTASLALSAGLALRNEIVTYSLHVFIALYALALALVSIRQNEQRAHTVVTAHLAILNVIVFFALFVVAILPDTTLHTQLYVIYMRNSPKALDILRAVDVVLYLVAAVLTMSMPLGPQLHYPVERIYSEKTVASITNQDINNVSGSTGASIWDLLFFSYTTKVVYLGNTAVSLDIGDLPVVPGNMRATEIFLKMCATLRTVKLERFMFWRFQAGDGIELIYQLVVRNKVALTVQMFLAALGALLYYAPPFFLNQLVKYLEQDPERTDRRWGVLFAVGLFASTTTVHLVTGQLWSVSTTILQVRFKVQLNSSLFAKTLVRKDVASGAAAKDDEAKSNKSGDGEDEDEEAISTKAQVMTLFTTDVDRVSEFAWHLFTLVDAPLEIIIGAIFLYKLLGVSAFIGLAVSCLFLPLNHFAGKVVVGAQDNLMKARDERVALMNEILGAIRMLKFMAWERSFEKRVLAIREKELKYQKLNYTIETLWNAIWAGSPILVTLAAFFHFAVIRGEVLTASTAFTSIAVFDEMKFALNALPETLINMLQSLVSLRRIEKYLHGREVAPIPSLGANVNPIAFQNATVTWPQDRSQTASSTPNLSTASTPGRGKFVLVDLNLNFPRGELSLVCGKLGSGKTLLLLSLLGEADHLTGQILCPRSPPDAIANLSRGAPAPEDWIVEGVCAYVPQAAWLRNASIKENILFNMPYDETRYQKTLEACALINDLKILEDGDESEIGERGVNLSGGQKARVSLARAVYSRASILLLDDVLSAVDAHTAHHLFEECLKGELMRGRTIVLVSHHVQLCAPGAKYVVALENGRVLYEGPSAEFQKGAVVRSLVQSEHSATKEEEAKAEAEDKLKAEEPTIEEEFAQADAGSSSSVSAEASEVSSTAVTATTADGKGAIEVKKSPRKVVEDEARAVGRVNREVWKAYFTACGSWPYWIVFGVIMVLATLSPVAERGWLTWWARANESGSKHSPSFYVGLYAVISFAGIFIGTLRWFALYHGSIRASTVLYKKLLETVLFANIRFHDTVSRGRLLNRFGKDFEGIDSSLADNFGRSVIYCLSVITTLVTISVVGGLPFLLTAMLIGMLYYNSAQVYGQTSRDMRRLDSATRSPLYSIYGETIAGVAIIRAFGASSKFLRDMLRCVDTNTNPYYWMWGVNRWLSVRFNILSAVIIGATGLVSVLTTRIDAALAGFMLAFAANISNDILFLVRRFVGLEQSMVALERVKEFSDLAREPPEFIEPRPPASWPEKGEIQVKDLIIRYAPELPNVLHGVNFTVEPGEKVGILGRTGSGKSTLALSFFRFVEATEGRIEVDGIDIASVGLTDLRSKLTIIPQDPTILSGTLRSTLDVFDEYEDADIYEALRRVHLIPNTEAADDDELNANVFRNLDSPVSEGGDNFSTGEKQLLCMARAILKRSRVLVMDEATASVDYATDELIGKTIRHEFADSTILTIAHRLRTVIDYNRVMLLDQGKIVELDTPGNLLKNPDSLFYSLCKATGKTEFAVLKKMAGVA